jgi:hypothetical protein
MHRQYAGVRTTPNTQVHGSNFNLTENIKVALERWLVFRKKWLFKSWR